MSFGRCSESRPERGRALLRKPTNEEEVALFTHVVPPELVKEFLYELGSQWAIFGTAAAGVAARGALALKKPTVLFALGEEHEKLLKRGVEAGIVGSVLNGGDFCSKTLMASWQEPQDDTSDSESDSNTETSASKGGSFGEDEGGGEQAEKGKKRNLVRRRRREARRRISPARRGRKRRRTRRRGKTKRTKRQRVKRRKAVRRTQLVPKISCRP